MEINWVTTGFQIVSFLIIVVLLRVFLYKKIIGAMDKREESIREKFERAEEREKEAKQEAETLRRKQGELEGQKQSMLDETKREAEKERKKLMDGIRQEIEEQKTRWQQALKQEKDAFLEDLKRRVSARVYAVSRKVLSEIADEDLERRIAKSFAGRIGEIAADQADELKAMRSDSGDPILVRSAFEMPEDMKGEIDGSLRSVLPFDFRTEYRTSDDVISGVEVSGNGRKVGWSLGDYISGLEEEMRAEVERKSTKEKPKGKPMMESPLQASQEKVSGAEKEGPEK